MSRVTEYRATDVTEVNDDEEIRMMDEWDDDWGSEIVEPVEWDDGEGDGVPPSGGAV